MGAQTRSTTSSSAPGPASLPEKQKQQSHEPLHLLILPKTLSADARILLLPCPRDGRRTRFLFCPTTGLYEFTKVTTPGSDYRSLLLAPADSNGNDNGDGPASLEQDGSDDATNRGHIQQEASFLVATPINLMFFLLPLLPSTLIESGKVMFQPMDDILETQMADNGDLRYLIQHGRPLVETAMTRFCDTIDVGNEPMFRVSEDKVVQVLHASATAVVARGLPASMEDKFVTRALEAPLLSIKREQAATTIPATESTENADESVDSQSTSAAPLPEPASISPHILHLMRLKVAVDFILASYFSSKIGEHLRAKILYHPHHKSTPLFPDFTPLHDHLNHISSLKAEALASRSLGDFSRKRGRDGDVEGEAAAEERAEKKRKREEDEKRKKANQSRGVRELSKVNVKGMKKMSDFFAKKPPVAAAGKSDT
ncbi:hypothetical protein DV736_g6241, partial [Chaetothyriales sp. CBS 134916]